MTPYEIRTAKRLLNEIEIRIAGLEAKLDNAWIWFALNDGSYTGKPKHHRFDEMEQKFLEAMKEYESACRDRDEWHETYDTHLAA